MKDRGSIRSLAVLKVEDSNRVFGFNEKKIIMKINNSIIEVPLPNFLFHESAYEFFNY